MRTSRTIPSLVVAILLALCGAVGAQDEPPVLECGNTFYDDGTSVGFDWFDGGQAGDPLLMFAVRFDLADFEYEPGAVELTGFCAGNLLSVGGVFPNEVFVYPDVDGVPDESTVLAQGQIQTGNGVGNASVVMFDEPVTLHGDFWLVNRGYAPLATTDFNMEYDEEPDSEHSFTSSDGIENLEPSTIGDYMLRAYVEPIQRTYSTAGMARSSGANNSEWRSQYSVLNTGDDVVEAEARLLSSEGVTTATGLVGPGQLVVWNDVVSDLFGLTDETTGSIVLDADGPLVVTSRTYNVGDEGTFGQYLPGIETGPVLTAGTIGVISQLANNDAFRTNIGYLNVSEVLCRVETRLYDSSGTQVGDVGSRQLDPGQWKQDNNIFNQLGAGTQDHAYARIRVIDDGCSIWAYGSVIDNGTGDPTTIPVVVD